MSRCDPNSTSSSRHAQVIDHLIMLLRNVEPGDLVTFAEMHRATGFNILGYRPVLNAARTWLEDKEKIFFTSVRGRGYVRQAAREAIPESARGAKGVVKKAKCFHNMLSSALTPAAIQTLNQGEVAVIAAHMGRWSVIEQTAAGIRSDIPPHRQSRAGANSVLPVLGLQFRPTKEDN
jgi:hypothetical protein